MRYTIADLRPLFVAAALAAIPAAVQTQTPAAPTPAQLADTVTRAFARWDVPAAAVAIVKDGQIVLVRGLGDGTTDLTSFYTASVTKTFTVAALGMLADEGQFRIDDPVTKHLAEFATGDAGLTTQLTVRDLMAHRTGLARADLLLLAGLTDAEVLGRLKGLTPAAPLRTRFTYQNQMYLALGEMVARLSGKPWSQFVTERILQPLGMTHSSARGLGHQAEGTTMARPHARLDGAVQPVTLVPRAPTGAGGIMSTGRDMAAWLQFLLGDGTWNGAKLLGPQVIAATRQPQMLTPLTFMAPEAVLSAYGLGWFLNDHHGHLIVQHGGNGEGWTSLVFLQPDIRLGVAVLTNMHNSMFPHAVAYAVADTYNGRPSRDWVAHYLTAERSRQAAMSAQMPVAIDGVVAAADWAGTYTSPVYGDLRLVATERGVDLQYGDALRATLRPTAKGVAAFWHRSDILAVVGPSLLRQSTAGGTTRLTLVLGGDALEFTRAR